MKKKALDLYYSKVYNILEYTFENLMKRFGQSYIPENNIFDTLGAEARYLYDDPHTLKFSYYQRCNIEYLLNILLIMHHDISLHGVIINEDYITNIVDGLLYNFDMYGNVFVPARKLRRTKKLLETFNKVLENHDLHLELCSDDEFYLSFASGEIRRTTDWSEGKFLINGIDRQKIRVDEGGLSWKWNSF